MRRTLVDNLNLTSTARHNLLICHKLCLSSGEITTVERKRIPAAYEGIVAYSNHLELDHINGMARACGGISSGAVPFQHNVEDLPPDNGERFSSLRIFDMDAGNESQLQQRRPLPLCHLRYHNHNSEHPTTAGDSTATTSACWR
jgi:hypothetical protein